jgi:hypothetical protein
LVLVAWCDSIWLVVFAAAAVPSSVRAFRGLHLSVRAFLGLDASVPEPIQPQCVKMRLKMLENICFVKEKTIASRAVLVLPVTVLKNAIENA